VAGGGQDAADLGPGDGAAHGDVHARGEPFLRFDGGEVLDVVAEVAARFWMNRSNSAANASASRAERS
jgi:hypothetical protein